MLHETGELGFSINRRQVLRAIGYRAGSRVPARTAGLVDEFLENARNLIGPAYTYNIIDAWSVRGNDVFVDGSIVFHSEVVARLLEECDRVAAFVLTIGDGLEEIVADLAGDGSVLKASVLDAIGSSAAEKVADVMQEEVRETVEADGMFVSRRFSPGYCDWDVTQQEAVFQAVDGASAGVQLTEGYLMLPRKSVSGIIGIGASASHVRDYNPCLTCPLLVCSGRRH